MPRDKTPELTLREMKERVKAKYGYDGRIVEIDRLAEDIYYFLIDKETIKRHRVNVMTNENIIKITTKDILKALLDKRLSCLSGTIGQALQVLHERGLIEIVKTYQRPHKKIYYIKVR